MRNPRLVYSFALGGFLALFAVALLAAETKPSSLEQQLVAGETRFWELVKQKQFDAFAADVPADYVDIFPDGSVHGRAEVLDYIRGVDLRSYTLTDFHVVMLSPDAAIVTYVARARAVETRAQTRPAEKGQEAESHAACTSGWARRDGRWVNVFYRENDLPPEK